MSTTSGQHYRVQSIDIVRGLVMVVMALDHVRDYFHVTAMNADPLDTASTTPALFFTRWITHFCAPVFVFLSGTSAYLVGQRKGRRQLSSFLVKRGIWLVVIEVVVMSFALTFNPNYSLIFLQVFWVIGVSMILLGLLVYLPYKILLAFGLVLLLGHNSFDNIAFSTNEPAGIFMNVFVTGRAFFYPLSAQHSVAVLYKVLPWTAVMICGYCTGVLFEGNISAARRTKALYTIGCLAILVFVLLRYSNVYGDPQQWQQQKNGWYTILAFINTTKYPPSLLFTCMTLGPALILLALLNNVRSKLTDFFTTFGRVPFFYFVVHFFLAHAICVVAFYATGYTNSQINDPASPFLFRPANFGFSLPVVYLLWLVVVAIMYPLCRWYGRYKATHAHWWLSYL